MSVLGCGFNRSRQAEIDPLHTFITIKLKGRVQTVPVNEANDLSALLGGIFCDAGTLKPL